MWRFLFDMLCYADSLLLFPWALHVMKAWILARSAEALQSLCHAELEEANVQLRPELATAHTKVAKVERREWSLTSDYDGLHRDFDDLQTSLVAIVKEKANLERVEHEKAQWFCNLLRKKLAELRQDMEESIATLGGLCMYFPTTNATISDMLEWFWTEVQSLPTTFAECNENITCFALIDVFKMLAGVGCEHLPELRKSALSCDASLLQDVPDDHGKPEDCEVLVD
jgi:hypothetical protein